MDTDINLTRLNLVNNNKNRCDSSVSMNNITSHL